MGLQSAGTGLVVGAAWGAGGGTLVAPGFGTVTGGIGGGLVGGGYGLLAGSAAGAARDLTSVVSSIDWRKVKDRIGRAVAGAALTGAIWVGGAADRLAKEYLNIQKAKAAAEAQKKKEDEELRRKEGEQRPGSGPPGGDPPTP